MTMSVNYPLSCIWWYVILTINWPQSKGSDIWRGSLYNACRRDFLRGGGSLGFSADICVPQSSTSTTGEPIWFGDGCSLISVSCFLALNVHVNADC